MKFEDVPEEWLRAWVDAGVISPMTYDTEMRRRAKEAPETTPQEAPIVEAH